MTEQEAAGGAAPEEGSSAEERDARLAALLSVDIGYPARAPDALPGHGADGLDAPPARQPTAEEVPVTEALVVEEPAPPPAEPAAAGTEVSQGVATGTRRDGWRTVASFAVLAGLFVAGLGLVYAGTEIVRNSTEGEVVSQVEDPNAPGYQALVEATPTLAVLNVFGEELDSVAVLSLPDPDGAGGGVTMVSRDTLLEQAVFGEAPLRVAYSFGNPTVATAAVGRIVGTAMAERAVVDAERWADLVAPVAPLLIDNPNEIVLDGEVRFAEGEIELEAVDVAPYLQAALEGESDLARLFRHELVWEAWFAAVDAAGAADAVPGELSSGIGRFVRTIAAGEAIIETLPVVPAPPHGIEQIPAFYPDVDEVESLLRVVVPFPVSPAPGMRARTRVLNGTSDTSRASAIAADLVPAGLEIVLVGNASTLDHDRTTVDYVGDDFRDEAEAIAEILGVGEVVEDDSPSDVVDITVTLGADYE